MSLIARAYDTVCVYLSHFPFGVAVDTRAPNLEPVSQWRVFFADLCENFAYFAVEYLVQTNETD
jgi:hypothetical protein